MIGIWTDQCGPACSPWISGSTSNPEFALQYHDELDAVMAVASGGGSWSPDNHRCWPDPGTWFWIDHHDRYQPILSCSRADGLPPKKIAASSFKAFSADVPAEQG